MITFNRSSLQGREHAYIHETIGIGQVAGDQTFCKKCHGLLEEVVGVRRALVTTSCTHALEMAAILLEIGPGDEVIVPAFTFVSAANAFVLRGARPGFCDIRPDTLNLDESKLEALITPRKRAIVPMPLRGGGMGLIAVSLRARGRALGRDLLRGAEDWFRRHGAGAIKAVTQRLSVAALRMYEGACFRFIQLQVGFHR